MATSLPEFELSSGKLLSQGNVKGHRESSAVPFNFTLLAGYLWKLWRKLKSTPAGSLPLPLAQLDAA